MRAAAAASTEVEFLAERVGGWSATGVALASEGAEPLWLSGSQLHRDLSLPAACSVDQLDSCWDRYLALVWQGELTVGGTREPGSGLGWRTAVRMLTSATEQVRHLEPTDTQAWAHATGQTADATTRRPAAAC